MLWFLGKLCGKIGLKPRALPWNIPDVMTSLLCDIIMLRTLCGDVLVEGGTFPTGQLACDGQEPMKERKILSGPEEWHFWVHLINGSQGSQNSQP